MLNTNRQEKEIVKGFKKAMDACLTGDPEQCRIEGCLGTEFRSGVGYCKAHWQEKLDREEKELQEHYEKQLKEQAKIDKSEKLQAEKELDQKAMRYFHSNPWCVRCGRHIQNGEQGRARLRKIQPKYPTHQCKRFETICQWCEEEGY